ncbi:MAG: YifB family Mg chelatase-like AAA ATPase [Eubacterium sp.]|nr:YifB family Mg chelatase-like AAA ATPase [Eubacterium sp.]
MYSKIYSGVALGIDGMLITVESDVSMGLPGLSLVGYLSSSVKEAAERVRTALRNSGYSIPSRKVTVNLSPGDVRKDGTGFDIAIAASILISMGSFIFSEEFNNELEETLFLGELGLDGTILETSGVLPIVDAAARSGIKRVVLPSGNCYEASFIKDVDIIPVRNLTDIISIFQLCNWGDVFRTTIRPCISSNAFAYDLGDIRGQEVMKRGIIIAVSGFHNIILTGAAGSGKSMIAKCIPELMPALSYEESLELTKIYSVAGALDMKDGLMTRRPFRSPGQNVTEAALLGGGLQPKPGEVSLANSGVLFMDEFPEFQRNVIEALRQPMEDKEITVTRVRSSYTFPARFMLVSARNNCPCGFFPDRKKCRCSASEIYHYQNRISHPIMDRIDIRLEVKPVRFEQLFSNEKGMDSRTAKEKIEGAIEIQKNRYSNEDFCFNSEIPQSKIEDYIRLGDREKRLLKDIFEDTEISARGYFKLLRLARTIADIEGREDISTQDIEEAAFFRNENSSSEDWR